MVLLRYTWHTVKCTYLTCRTSVFPCLSCPGHCWRMLVRYFVGCLFRFAQHVPRFYYGHELWGRILRTWWNLFNMCYYCGDKPVDLGHMVKVGPAGILPHKVTTFLSVINTYLEGDTLRFRVHILLLLTLSFWVLRLGLPGTVTAAGVLWRHFSISLIPFTFTDLNSSVRKSTSSIYLFIQSFIYFVLCLTRSVVSDSLQPHGL